ncbi:hypothetical protein FN976_22950 [Caenimonas sedimenti]|uniref:Uncharacterized protein n=1 Tax=Caenimonas sedimenti TaxID=2596921 RepID=A0A562ZIT7_9BURK|nr:hypothetical protein [Caenimonas sedimenti]TWO68492.1 hypothetical protein FN976_22950 [Caenimonas sedimenti]
MRKFVCILASGLMAASFGLHAEGKSTSGGVHAGNGSGADWGGSPTVICPEGLAAKNNECSPPGKRKALTAASTSTTKKPAKKSATTTLGAAAR